MTRERLVLAREEERRRLRRDLHDGLGPALAGLTCRGGPCSRRRQRRTPPASCRDALRDDLRATVLDVRRVVEGLRPPALDELGLVGACAQAVERMTAGAAWRLAWRLRDLPPLPAAIEVAAFRIVIEAVTNIVRHAQARHCRVSMPAPRPGWPSRSPTTATGSTGQGHPGHGLAIMRERAEELRGTVRSGTAHPASRSWPAAGRDRARARFPASRRCPHDRVLVVDDHPVFRTAWPRCSRRCRRSRSTGPPAPPRQALAAISETAPDVVLMDMNLPSMSGVEATRPHLRSPRPPAVLVVTMVDDDDTVFAALAAGARGYVLKGASADEIAAAVRTVAAGGAVFGAGVATRLLPPRPDGYPARRARPGQTA